MGIKEKTIHIMFSPLQDFKKLHSLHRSQPRTLHVLHIIPAVLLKISLVGVQKNSPAWILLIWPSRKARMYVWTHGNNWIRPNEKSRVLYTKALACSHIRVCTYLNYLCKNALCVPSFSRNHWVLVVKTMMIQYAWWHVWLPAQILYCMLKGMPQGLLTYVKGRQLFETTHLFWDGNTTSGLQTQTLNVWYIYLHLVDFYDKWW